MSDLGPDDLVLHAGSCQRRTFAELCEAASAGGFRAVTIYAAHYRGAREAGMSDADLRTLLDDHGLVVADLDCVLDCYSDPEFEYLNGLQIIAWGRKPDGTL